MEEAFAQSEGGIFQKKPSVGIVHDPGQVEAKGVADGEKHGYAVIKEVARRTDGQVRLRAGTLYTVIRRFVDDGLVAESEVRPDPALDDERRRYYRLTERGRAVAVAETRRMAETLAQARAKLGTL